MSKYLEYKGYRGNVEYSAEDKCFFGKLLGINALVTYEGQSVKEIETEFKASVNEYLALCKRRDIAPEKEYSGRFGVRIKPELHKRIALESESEHRTMNSLVGEIMEIGWNAYNSLHHAV
jgi:predicted HicB family RNase H-like nuclease